MSLPRLAYHEYTIGWICARREELLAATAMLDQRHEHLPVPLSDYNRYVLGSIGRFNIVVACLPVWEIGSPSASIVAKRIQATFPNVASVLMVGIGSGVPSKENDVRLGDVVVSTTTAISDDVDYENMAMSNDSGFRVPSLFPESQPSLFTTAISKLESWHRVHGNNIQSHLSQMLRTYPELSPRFTRPASFSDVLYEPVPSIRGWVQIERPERQPNEVIKVHHGRIATGNTVIETGYCRESISESLGGVLCFEKVAADLMCQMPCVVIRGICDYADAHANTEWQEYAAAVAAAYAKEFILAAPVLLSGQQNEIQELEALAFRRGMEALTIQRHKILDAESHWLVPFSRNNHFTGREQELYTLQKWSSIQGSCRRMAISGVQGQGKSQVALEFAYRTKARNPGCSVFWVPATNLPAFEGALWNICRMLNISGLEDDGVDIKTLVKDRLSNDETLGPWLMIVDDVCVNMMIPQKPSGNDKEPLTIMDYLPFSLNGTILFTMQDSHSALEHAGNNVISLEAISCGDAEILLRKSLLQPQILSDRQATKQLLRSLEFLPLAIMLAVAYINENGIGVSEYMDLMNGKNLDRIQLLSSDFHHKGSDKTTKNPIVTTWLVSVDHIKYTNPLAIEYLFFMTSLSNQSIPESLLPVSSPPKQGQDAIGVLMAYSLIEKRDIGQMYVMRRHVRLAMMSWRLFEHMFPLSYWEARAVSHVGKLLSDMIDQKMATRASIMPLHPHVEYLLSKELLTCKIHGNKANIVAQKFAKVLDMVGCWRQSCLLYMRLLRLKFFGPRIEVEGLDGHKIWRLTEAVAEVLFMRKRHKEAEAVLGEVLELRKNASMCKDQGHFFAIYQFATAIGLSGRIDEAKRIIQDNMASQIRVMGSADYAASRANHELLTILLFHRKFQEASIIAKALHEIRLRLEGATQNVDYMQYLARVQLFLRGKEEDALKGLNDIQARFPAERQSGMTCTKAVQSRLLLKQEKFKRQWRFQCQSWKARVAQLGEYEHRSVSCLSCMAATCFHQGQLHHAIGIQQRVVNLLVETIGPGHPETMEEMWNLMTSVCFAGRLADAKGIAEFVMESGGKGPRAGFSSTGNASCTMAKLAEMRQDMIEARKEKDSICEMDEESFLCRFLGGMRL
ncbi:hypothetical protein E4U21_001842 [Claviceps maximensis]|nr:hypothetical protein E4U21_001842 [Claviceps maximensis]